jgi:ATPase components of ABC transporters with duplicated ATPase domains
MAHLLGAQDVRVEYPTSVVFDGITVGIGEGDKIGVVGPNGEGKTTLLRVLSGEQKPDSGVVIPRSDLRIGYLPQADNLDPEMTVSTVVVGDTAEHVWAGNLQTRQIIDGLVGDIPWDASIKSLSGGQRRRVALAALLVPDWDVLILDEPTNHLDLEGITWLASHLKTRGALIVVTHDRWFLDEVSNATWEIHDGIVEPFEGGYAAYVLQRVERDRIKAATEAKRQNLMRKELAWLRRGAPARTSKPKFRLDAAAALIEDVPEMRNSIELQRLATARLGKDVVDLLDVGMRFDGNQVLEDVTWRIAPGERAGILGANGAGKSTLLNIISGELSPTSGRVRRGKTVQLGVLDQEFRILVDIRDKRVREVLAETKTLFEVDGKDLTPAQLLERLGFRKSHLSSRVHELSGGQKRRLQLLLTLLEEPNVLILDEPTNDVDTDMLAALEDLLDSWPGTLLVVSHDRYLLERVTDHQYGILDKTLRHLPGGIDEYLKLQADSKKTPSKQETTSTPNGPSMGLVGAELRAAQKELSSLERRMERLEKNIADVHTKMADHDQSDYEGLQKFTVELGSLKAEASELEEHWLTLSEQLD